MKNNIDTKASFKGFCIYGVAKVLSTITKVFGFVWASLESASKSTIFKFGLAGVSR